MSTDGTLDVNYKSNNLRWCSDGVINAKTCLRVCELTNDVCVCVCVVMRACTVNGCVCVYYQRCVCMN